MTRVLDVYLGRSLARHFTQDDFGSLWFRYTAEWPASSASGANFRQAVTKWLLRTAMGLLCKSDRVELLKSVLWSTISTFLNRLFP